MNTAGHNVLFTVDLEDWFQVENLKRGIPFTSWSSHELRVEESTHSILDLLDSLRQKGAHAPPRATFFVLGWIAERLPHLVREIYTRGHEIASHGYSHRCCYETSFAELAKDLVGAKDLLEDIIGAPVRGYRAPNFSINDDVLKIIEACGYSYDSSYNSFGMNRRYGRVNLARYETEGIAVKVSDTFYELPISNLVWCRGILPWGGGGYFRLIPLPLFRLGVQSILEKEGAYLFYLHPWEVDPDQPRVDRIPAFYRFRHYVNLSRTRDRVSSLFGRIGRYDFVSCHDYLGLVSRRTDSP